MASSEKKASSRKGRKSPAPRKAGTPAARKPVARAAGKSTGGRSEAVRPQPFRLTPSNNEFLGMDVESLKESFVHNLEFALAKDEYSATDHDNFKSLALTVRDRLFQRWIETQP